MAHDINGTLLEIGDSIVVEGVITELQVGDEYCNLTMKTDEPMFPSESPSTIVLNTKQVTLCRKAELIKG